MGNNQRESLCYPGFFHIYNRGVNRERIFWDEDDYSEFVRLIPIYLNREVVSIHGFTTMPNHFHFILQQTRPYAISTFMKGLSETFARKMNHLHRRVGHLFQGRFKRKQVTNENYLLTLLRYIDLNPVHSRLVSTPEDWKFGSVRSYLSLESNTFLRTDTILGLAGGVKSYVEFLNRPPEILGSEVENLLIDREML